MLMNSQNVPTVRTEILAGIRAATTGIDLHRYMQSAVELEHATIPPYLTAYYSIARGSNDAIARIVLSVVKEEMLHMTIAANVLNAIGGSPVINKPDFIPTYPGTLPMSVDGGLVVGLAPFSYDLIENVFMRIELPEHPLALTATRELEFNTIGEFYDAIKAQILTLGEEIFTGDKSRQVVDNTWFPACQLFSVHDVESAIRALDVIIVQGEGWSHDPWDGFGQPAHYYRFQQIVKQHFLVKNPDGTSTFTGPAIPFEPHDVIPLLTNSAPNDYAPGTPARDGVNQADYTYTTLLNALHQTFNGDPSNLKRAIGLMYELKLVIDQKVINQPTPAGPFKGQFAAPSFRYTPFYTTADSQAAV